jgi:hypothetical protein
MPHTIASDHPHQKKLETNCRGLPIEGIVSCKQIVDYQTSEHITLEYIAFSLMETV